MIAETKPAPVESVPHGATSRIENVKRELAPRWAEFWEGAVEAAGAEMSIVAMKAARVAVTAVAGMAACVAVFALFIYGFVLLDRCLDYALSGPGWPAWFSPLLRGGVYFGIPLIGFLVLRSELGGGKDDEEIRSEAQSEAGREVARGNY